MSLYLPHVMSVYRGLLPAALLALFGSTMSLAEDGPLVSEVRSIEGIQEYKLDNGLQVLLFPDESKPTVTVNLTIFVGSRHEGYGETGMAHLLEHMLFKGTPTHPQVPKVLQERGARFNGTTWVDRTNYYETLPASPENLEFALRLEADRFVNSNVRAEDLASEMTVVRNEFESGENSPQRILGQRMFATAFEWHNYGKSTIGNRADIERVPIDNLKAFYKKYYRPENATLVVAGNFDVEQALEFVGKYFAPIKNPETPLPTTYTEEPPQDGERTVTLRRVGDVALAGLMYHIPPGSDKEYAAIDVLEKILTGAPSGRLYKALVETGRAADLSGAAFAWHDPGALRILAEVAEGNDPRDLLATMVEIVETIGDEGVTQEEVDRAKARLLKQREMVASDSTRIAIELSEWAAMGDWRLYFMYRDWLEAVTPEAVNEVAKKYLERENRTAGLFLPTKKSESVTIPQPKELAEVIGDYKGREVIAAGEQFDVSPENIESRAERLTLDNGVDVALLQKQNRGDTVVLRLVLRYGDEKSLQNCSTACDMLPALMLRGTESKNRQEIQDKLDALQAQISGSGSPGLVRFAVKAKKSTLPEVLELLEDVLRHPTLPQEEFDIMKQSRVTSAQSQLTDPQALATSTVRKELSPWPKGDPRYVPSLPEQVEMYESVTRDDVAKIYNDMVAGTPGQVAVVGTFDRDGTLAAMEKMLAGWDPKSDFERLGDKVRDDLTGSSEVIQTPDKKNAVYFEATTIPMDDTDSDYAALVIGDYILGGGALSSRLGDRVRQQEGLSYGIGSGFNARSLDDRAAFYVYAITNPENVPRLTKAIDEEVAKFLEEGVTQEELDKARNGYLERQEVSRSDDSELARLLAETAYLDRTMAYYSQLQERILSLTPAEIQSAFQEHYHPNKFVQVVAGDLKNVESE
ncbi:Protease 3 precursor [Calycomorphotria hydatis]|uniref:Protease 3 n=2 Tax=Calycomorphotria hydatis TaxID=2528027 RepID=A0A517T7Y3_9PLAN|nr:Protease 3 precursor [Calycomorphotria hydatis]